MPKTSYYRRGYVLENDAEHYLKEQGYFVVRSSKSGGLCDLIAIPSKDMEDEKPLCLQCKKTTVKDTFPSLSKKELNELKTLQRTHNVKVIIVVRYRLKGRWHTEYLTIDEYVKKKAEFSKFVKE